jgi:hypothetical protein
MQQASKLFYDKCNAWVAQLNANSENIYDLVKRREAPDRNHAYEAAVEIALGYLRAGQDVCWAMYGHAGIGVFVSRAAIRRARLEGYEAVMLPGISATRATARQ